MVIATTPLDAQTSAITDAAQERSQKQSDNVYRWIKYFAEQPKKVDPYKARPKINTPPLSQKPEVKAPTVPTQPEPATDSVATPSTIAQPGTEAPHQPVPLVAAVETPVAPEPEVVAQAEPPLKPINVIEPPIPRELRNESINTIVRLSFTVQKDGTVANPKVVSGHNSRLNRSAMNAIAQWRFEPLKTDRPTQIEFEFRQE